MIGDGCKLPPIRKKRGNYGVKIYTDSRMKRFYRYKKRRYASINEGLNSCSNRSV